MESEDNRKSMSPKRKADYAVAHLFLHPIGWIIIWAGLYYWAMKS